MTASGTEDTAAVLRASMKSWLATIERQRANVGVLTAAQALARTPGVPRKDRRALERQLRSVSTMPDAFAAFIRNGRETLDEAVAQGVISAAERDAWVTAAGPEVA